MESFHYFVVNKVKCEEKICENGGTIDEFCECICPPGYNGTTCNIGGRSGESLIYL